MIHRYPLLILCFSWLSFFASTGTQAQVAVFENSFEEQTTCQWTQAQPVRSNCPPIFPGVISAVAQDQDEVRLSWLPAVDDATASSNIVYRIHFSDVEGFEPSPGTLFKSVANATQTTVSGLIPGTAYYALVLAEDAQGAQSVERQYTSLRTPAFSVIRQNPGELVQAASLNLGAPTSRTASALTFARTPGSMAPSAGDILVGEDGDSGYLRRVEQVTTTGSQYVVQTSPVRLADAVQQMTISNTTTLEDLSSVNSLYPEAMRTKSDDFEMVSVQRKDGATYRRAAWGDPKIVAEQTDFTNGPQARGFDFGEVEVEVDLDFRPRVGVEASWSLFGGIESGELIASGDLGLTARASYDFNGSKTINPSPRNIFRRNWRVSYLIGGVPVIQKITLSADLQFSATAQTEVHAEARASARSSASFGARYDPVTSTWNQVSSTGFSRTLSADLSIAGQVQAEAKVVIKVIVETYEAVAASLRIVPKVSGRIGAESTALPSCAPFQLTAFDFDLAVNCFGDVELTAFNLNYSIVEDLRLCGPLLYKLFRLPEIDLNQTGTGTGSDPFIFNANISDGTNNPFDANSAMWEVSPSGGTLTPSGSQASFVCGSGSEYEVVFSGHGRLGEAARQCHSRRVDCGFPVVVTLTWDHATDVDLHVFEPNGTQVYYSNRTGQSGFLDVDNTTGFGPENYFVRMGELELGTYQVGVNYYSGSILPETARIRIEAGSVIRNYTVSLSSPRGTSGNASPIPVAAITVTTNGSGGYEFSVQ